jgi:hypothetical protein
MKKLLTLTFALALVPAFSPAAASSATLAQRVSKLEADFAGYGTGLGGLPSTGPNGAQTYTEPDSNNPDSLE